jgi:thioredoxin reductase (NADPH)
LTPIERACTRYYVRRDGVGEVHEAVIIGGGPAGLTAGIYLRRAGIETLLVDGQVTGGMPVMTEHVENYPGFPDGIGGRELMDRMAAQAKRFGLLIKEFFSVEEVLLRGGRFVIRSGEASVEASGVIAAGGTQPAKLGIPGEDEFVGRGVSYCATCDAMFFRELEVAVIGGGDAAIEEALTLANLARRVYVIHRRDKLRAQKILQERAFRNSRMEFLWNKAPVRITGGAQVESIVLEDTQSREQSTLPVSGIFFYVGSRPDTSFYKDLVDRDEAGFIVTKEDLSTRTPGLFAAGDVRKKSLRQVTTAVGDGALAAVNLEKYILEQR